MYIHVRRLELANLWCSVDWFDRLVVDPSVAMLAVLVSVALPLIFLREYWEDMFELKLPRAPVLLPPELPIVVAPDSCEPPEFNATNDDFFLP